MFKVENKTYVLRVCDGGREHLDGPEPSRLSLHNLGRVVSTSYEQVIRTRTRSMLRAVRTIFGGWSRPCPGSTGASRCTLRSYVTTRNMESCSRPEVPDVLSRVVSVDSHIRA